MSLQKIQAERDKIKRLRVLQTLDLVRPEVASAQLILRSLSEDKDLALTISDIQRALDYLAQRQLINLVDAKSWMAKILPDGIDYLDGHGNNIAGVARPSDF
ncbi:MAG: hypothetical protein COB35_04965 [Gammaproteobacteria bacterium]|nr:MAG: hypothetical protein COB35_04965 [Gammaproteobacteria bacterium]